MEINKQDELVKNLYAVVNIIEILFPCGDNQKDIGSFLVCFFNGKPMVLVYF